MKLKNSIIKGNISFLLLCILLSINLNNGIAQEEMEREFQPDEYITLNRDIALNVALEIINKLSTKYENKIIVDSKERKNKIGVVVDNMHWKRALEYILRSNQLAYNVHPRHYEIIELSEKVDEKKVDEGMTQLLQGTY